MYRLNTTIRSKMPRLRGFELHSRWVPLNNSASFLIVSKVANC